MNGSHASTSSNSSSSGTTIRINGLSVVSQPTTSNTSSSGFGNRSTSGSPSLSTNSSSHSHHHHRHHHRSPSPQTQPPPPAVPPPPPKPATMSLSQALSSNAGLGAQFSSYVPSNATASSFKNKYTPADVRFRPLAFYDHLETIQPPTALVAESHSRLQQSIFTITLTANQVNRIRQSLGRANPPDYAVQAQLRFCKYSRDTRTVDVDDYLPSGLQVKFNSKAVTLPVTILFYSIPLLRH